MGPTVLTPETARDPCTGNTPLWDRRGPKEGVPGMWARNWRVWGGDLPHWQRLPARPEQGHQLPALLQAGSLRSLLRKLPTRPPSSSFFCTCEMCTPATKPLDMRHGAVSPQREVFGEDGPPAAPWCSRQTLRADAVVPTAPARGTCHVGAPVLGMLETVSAERA